MTMSVRLFARELRALCPTSTRRGVSSRCLSTVGGSVAGPDRSQHGDKGTNGHSTLTTSLSVAGAVTSGFCLAWYLHRRSEGTPTDHQQGSQSLLPQLRASGSEGKASMKISVRERRYKDFSSIRYKGEPYMTPRDFLESVTLDDPRRKDSYSENTGTDLQSTGFVGLDPNFMNDKDIQDLLKLTLPLSKGSRRTFRDMWNAGGWCGAFLQVHVESIIFLFSSEQES